MQLTALKSQCPGSRAKHLLWWDSSSVGSPLTHQVGLQWEWGRRGHWWRCCRCSQLPFPAIVFVVVVHVDSDGDFTTGGDSLCSVSATSACSDLPLVMTIAASLAVILKPVNHRHLFHPPSLTYGGVLKCYGNLSSYCWLGRLPQSAGQHGRSMSWHTSSGWYPHILLSLQASVWSADRKLLYPLQWDSESLRYFDKISQQLTIFTSYKMTSLYLRNIHLNVFNLAVIRLKVLHAL